MSEKIQTNILLEEKRLFFSFKTPNKETIQAIKEFENRETEKVTLEELKEELKQWRLNNGATNEHRR